MILKDEHAPLDPERPCVSVSALIAGKEVDMKGEAAIIVVLSDCENAESVVGGSLGAAEIAMLNRAAIKAADDAAASTGCELDYRLGIIHLLVDEMAGRGVAHAAD